MGQKVHPKGLRLGIIRPWDAKWFADKDFKGLLHEDLRVRDFVKKKLFDSGVAQVEIERAANRLKVTIHTAKPGMVIGRGGTEVERLRQTLEHMTRRQVAVNIVEIKVPELTAQLVAENVAAQLRRRISFRRAIKQAAQRTMRSGARGVKVMVSGRLGGAELSRTEWTSEGSVPLHTLRADIDYGFAEAATTYGRIGVKVWIYRGEVLPQRAVDRPGEGRTAARSGPSAEPAPAAVAGEGAR
jgi:small subunit ribosomal protein S3